MDSDPKPVMFSIKTVSENQYWSLVLLLLLNETIGEKNQYYEAGMNSIIE